MSSLFPTRVFASNAQATNKTVSFKNLHTGEQFVTSSNLSDQLSQSELNKIYHLLRDFRRNEVHQIDNQLLAQLNGIQTLLKTNAEIQIISGYRSPHTNESLRAKSGGVAKKSFHMQGKALDFKLDGVPLAEVRDAAKMLKAGGVGYYPSSDFVHIDSGAVRSW
jgi:uncharacterized protein YcbK (DUF882 family)